MAFFVCSFLPYSKYWVTSHWIPIFPVRFSWRFVMMPSWLSPFPRPYKKLPTCLTVHTAAWWNQFRFQWLAANSGFSSTAMLLKNPPGAPILVAFFDRLFLGSVFSSNSTDRDLANSFGMGKMPLSELVLSVIRFYHLWDFEKDTPNFWSIGKILGKHLYFHGFFIPLILWSSCKSSLIPAHHLGISK